MDLTIAFATEISGYSSPWQWIKSRISSHNLDGIRICDYIPITIENNIVKMQIAGINSYTHTTDQNLGWHIDWISKDCYPDTVKWFDSNDNNGTAADPYPYNKSTIKTFLSGLEEKLPEEVRTVIISKRFFLEQRYSASGKLNDSTACGWQDIGKLWIPCEYEVFGSCIWSTVPWGAGQAMQYPIFVNNWKNRVKRASDGGGRSSWWMLSVCTGSSSSACLVSNDSVSGGVSCTYDLRVPVCFRITE